MTMSRLAGGGFFFPAAFFTNPMLTWAGTSGAISLQTIGTVDAVNEKIAMVGHVHWAGHPSAAKTMGATSKIHFRTGTVTFADGSSSLRVGLQDIATGTGPPAQPDGTFDVYKDVVVAGGELSSASDNVVVSVTLSTSGSKSVTEGDLIAVVLDLTARGGSDSVTVTGLAGTNRPAVPGCLTHNATSWASNSTGGTCPNVLLEASDGTLGILSGGTMISGGGALLFSVDETEYGLIFRPPWIMDVDSIIHLGGSNQQATADAEVNLYSTPLGTPASMASATILGEQTFNATDDAARVIQLSAPVRLYPTQEYCIAIKGTGAADYTLGYLSLGSEAHRPVQGLANCRQGSRTTGAFSEDATVIPMIALGVCGLDTGQPAPTYILGVP